MTDPETVLTPVIQRPLSAELDGAARAIDALLRRPMSAGLAHALAELGVRVQR